jgi:ABC-2 type transport system ATP-binding protein
MRNLAIVAEELTYQYGELTAVDHINFQVAEGEILGFLGPNGAGKSTTVRMLTGQLLPKAGKATLHGSGHCPANQANSGQNWRLL